MRAERRSLTSRFMGLQYRLYDRIRHRRAFELAGQPGSAEGLDGFDGARHCLVVTFKRSGEPVPTPVNFGIADGKLYFRSEPHVAKIARIRNDPHVRVGPCSVRGKPFTGLTEGQARVLPDSEVDVAYQALRSNWRADMFVMETTLDRLKLPAVYVEVTPVDAGA